MKKSLLLMLFLALTWAWTGVNAQSLFSEDFEDGTMPSGWTTEGSGTWSVGTGDYSTSTGAGQGTYNALIEHSTTGNVTKLITPEIDLSSVSSAELSFMHIQRSWAGDHDELRVYYRSSSSDAWIKLLEYTSAVATWTAEDGVVLPNLSSTYQLAFEMTDNYGYGVGIDAVNIVQGASCVKPSGLEAILTQGNGSIATLSWVAGGTETAWVLEYGTASDFAGATSVNVSGTPSKDLTGLTPETTYYARVKADCGGGDASEWSSVINFTPTNAFSLIVNEGTETSYYVPFYYYVGYYNSKSQFVIPSTNLASIQWANIIKLSFYNSTSTVSYGNATFDVYISEVSATTLSDFVDWTSLAKVYSGTVSVNDNLMTISFNSPYTYQGGNLLIGFSQTALGTSPSSNTWVGSSGASGCARYETYSASSSNFLPKMKIEYTPGNPPTCFKPTDLAVTLTPGNGTIATLSWTAGSETNWVLEYGETSDFTGATSVNISGTPSKDLTGLTAETTYYARVKADCGGDGESEWSNAISFEPTAKIIIGSGTGTIGSLPSNTNYNYSLTQQIFTAAELGAAGLIESIDFFMTSASAITRSLDIYMVSTDKENFESATDWVPVSASNLVFSGEVDFAAQAWTTITLDNGFIYNGAKNVVIVVDDNTGSWSGRSFKSFTASNQALYKYQDESDIPVNYTAAGSLGASKNQIRILKGELPACAKPTGLTSSQIGKTSVTLSWTENGNATAWDIMLNNDAENLVVANTNPFVLNGLSAETDYVVAVRANCGGEWSSEINFTTLQACPAPISLAVVAASETARGATISWEGDADSYNVLYGIPSEVNVFSADFESGDLSAFVNTSTKPWAIVETEGSHSGNHCVKSGNEGENSTSSELILDFTLSGEGSISFWAKISSESGYDKGYFYIDNVAKVDGISGAGAWKEYNYSLTAGVHTLKWKYTKDSSTASNDDCFYVDDIQITDNIVSSWTTIPDVESPYTFTNLQAESTYQAKVQSVCGGTPGHETGTVTFTTAAACQMADNLAADDITASSAVISWNAYGQKGFNLRYSVDGTNWTSATSENSPYSLTSLDPNTSYEVQVQPTCAGADDWSASLEFKTECEAITITFDTPYEENFEDPVVTTAYNEEGQMPDCWKGSPASSAGPKILSEDDYYNFATSGQVLYFYGSGNNYAVLPKFSNPLNDLQISFKWATESASYGTLTLGYITDGDEDFNTFKAIKAFPASSESDDTFVPENIFLDTLPASASKLVFRWYYSGQWGCNVDDIVIRLANIVDINASEYATYFNSEKAYIMPAGVTGHAFANGVLSDAVYQSADVVPAAIPLVLHGPAGSYLLASSSEAGAPLDVANDLIGVNVESVIADEAGYKFYVLSLAEGKNPGDDDSNVGFYWMNSTGAGGFTMPAHKAYLKYGASSAPAAFFLFNGENGATWLENLEGVEGTVKFLHEGKIFILREGVIYDATGRQVRKL